MKLNPTEIRAIVFVLRCHRQSGNPVPPSVAALSKRMESAVLHGDASPWRQSQPAEPVDWSHVEFIGSRLAARRLGWTLRRVQRHAADLQGRMVGARLVFPAGAVDEFRDHLDTRNELTDG